MASNAAQMTERLLKQTLSSQLRLLSVHVRNLVTYESTSFPSNCVPNDGIPSLTAAMILELLTEPSACCSHAADLTFQ
jgi:hypothetical protein